MVGALHTTYSRVDRAPRLIGVGFTWLDDGLLAYHASAFDLAILIGTVVYNPMTPKQLHRMRAAIGNHYGIAVDVGVAQRLAGRGLVLGCNGHLDLVGRMGVGGHFLVLLQGFLKHEIFDNGLCVVEGNL